jgi:hypothetical protein
VQGAATARDRVEGVIAQHGQAFSLRERFRVSETRSLDPPVLLALLQGSYRGARFREAARAASIGDRLVTLASDVCVFERHRLSGPPDESPPAD